MTDKFLRLEKAGPMLEQIKAAIVAARIDALPKSPLAISTDALHPNYPQI